MQPVLFCGSSVRMVHVFFEQFGEFVRFFSNCGIFLQVGYHAFDNGVFAFFFLALSPEYPGFRQGLQEERRCTAVRFDAHFIEQGVLQRIKCVKWAEPLVCFFEWISGWSLRLIIPFAKSSRRFSMWSARDCRSNEWCSKIISSR